MKTGLRMSLRFAVLAWMALTTAHSPLLAQNELSCSSPDWFTVRQAEVQGKKLSPLCQGELDAAADRRALAEKELKSVIGQGLDSAEAYRAHSVLSHFYLRIGRFRDAEAQIVAMTAAKPGATDLANIRSLFALLGEHPDLAVLSSHPATVLSQTIDGNAFMPLMVNGATRTYMLDTGLNLSMMSEVEAKRLGLTPQSSTTRLSDISGLSGPQLRMVEVENLVIGETHLAHVPFLVVSDTNGAFVGIPEGQHAILGIQPLLALGTLSFQPDGTIVIDSRSQPGSISAPLLFEGEIPINQINYKGRPLTVTFDMGATQTTIDPPFAKLYPELLQSGSKEKNHKLNGLSGTTAQRSIYLPYLDFDFGRKVHLKPAVVLLDQTTGASAWAAANLGYDLMQQARPFTLNFRRMTIEFP